MKALGCIICGATIAVAAEKIGYTILDWQWFALCAPVWIGAGLIAGAKE